MTQLTLVSWNVHGIPSQTKIIKILEYVTKLKADIFLLQETHLLKLEENSLIDSNFNQIFSSYYNNRQRGV